MTTPVPAPAKSPFNTIGLRPQDTLVPAPAGPIDSPAAGVAVQIAGDPVPPLPRANHPHIPVDPPAVAPTAAQVRGEQQPNVVAARGAVGARTVDVRLIWPAARGAKIDCRGGTGILWTEHGDVQPYPADKWNLLSPHPDVWELVNPADVRVAAQAHVDHVETSEQRLLRVNSALGIGIAATESVTEAQRLDAERLRALGQQTNTDTVVLSPGPSIGRPSTEHAPTRPVPEVISAQLAPNTYDAAALAPHTETAALVEAARAEGAKVAEHTLEKAPLPTPDNFEAPAVVVPGLAPLRAGTAVLNRDQLDAMGDERIHAEGVKRGFALHPRLTPPNLRVRFLELQDEAASKLSQPATKR